MSLKVKMNVLLYYEAQWLIYVPPGLTLKNSTFCPHSVFLCLVWFPEETAAVCLTALSYMFVETSLKVCIMLQEPTWYNSG